MVRRSLWFGLRVGILLGLAVAVAKAVRSRRPESPADEPWEPIAPRPTAPASTTSPSAAARAFEEAVEQQIAAEPPEEVAADIEAEEDLEDEAMVEATGGPSDDAGAPTLDIADALTIERDAGPASAPAPSEAHASSAPGESLDPLDVVPPAAPSSDPAAPVAASAAPATGGSPTKTPKAAAPAKKAAAKATRKAAKATTSTAKPSAKATKKAAPVAPWVDPDGGICPQTHPVKAKLASKLFHLPGMFAYDRTKPDRCYADAGAAEADGFTRSKR